MLIFLFRLLRLAFKNNATLGKGHIEITGVPEGMCEEARTGQDNGSIWRFIFALDADNNVLTGNIFLLSFCLC